MLSKTPIPGEIFSRLNIVSSVRITPPLAPITVLLIATGSSFHCSKCKTAHKSLRYTAAMSLICDLFRWFTFSSLLCSTRKCCQDSTVQSAGFIYSMLVERGSIISVLENIYIYTRKQSYLCVTFLHISYFIRERTQWMMYFSQREGFGHIDILKTQVCDLLRLNMTVNRCSFHTFKLVISLSKV